MTDTRPTRDRSICNRKERRYKTSEERVLRCETFIDGADSDSQDAATRYGTVIDLSSSGIRMLVVGQYRAGQKICTELTTDRSHGIYRGIVRRVEPWVAGQSILGCSLDDSIADSVLQDLASQGVVNRRSDGRMSLEQSAKISWQLNSEMIDAEIKDYSNGGMKIHAPVSIPDGVTLRIQIDRDDREPLCVQAKLVWKHDSENGCVAGVAFAHRDTPVEVAAAFGFSGDGAGSSAPKRLQRIIRTGALVAATLFAIAGALHANGVTLPWAIAWTR